MALKDIPGRFLKLLFGADLLNTGADHIVVKPVITIAIGFFVSFATAWVAGWLSEWIFIGWFELREKWNYVFFWPVACFVFWELFVAGLGNHVETKHEGVPEFLKTRIWWFTLSEGDHWLFPFLMSFISVDMRVNTTNPPIEVSALSSDGVLMKALIAAVYQVETPALSLNVGGPMVALRAMAESEVRAVFASTTSEDLEQADVKKDLGARIKAEVDQHDCEFGLDVSKIFEPEILPPEAITNARARLRTEKAEASAEELELRKVRERVKELLDDGLAPELAYEIVQTERGKLTGTRNIQRFEGLKGVADVVGAAIAAVIAAKQQGDK